MPAPIGTIGQLVTIIRSQLADRADLRPDLQNRPPLRPSTQAARSGPPTPVSLETLIRQRIQRIAHDDPQRGRKAFRVFLEAILLRQFGETMLNDPAFHQLVEDIQTTMETDAEIRALIDKATNQLLSGKT